jgi:hypothetical protein
MLRFDVVEGVVGGEREGIVSEVREYSKDMRRRCVHHEVVKAMRGAIS